MKNNNTYWVCGEKHGHKKDLTIWTIVGVFDEKPKAINACTTKSHFIGPLKLNERLPDGVTTWPDCYYPKEHDG